MICVGSIWVRAFAAAEYPLIITSCAGCYRAIKKDYILSSAYGEMMSGIEVVHTLERLGVAFTGATSSFYEPSREAMKRVCAAAERVGATILADEVYR